jgi:hypothetical protein
MRVSSNVTSSSASNELTTSRTATSSDNNKTYTNAVGSNVYLTIDSGLPRGFRLSLVAGKTGSIGAIAGSGVTFTGDVPIAVLAGQIITIEWTAADTYAVAVGTVSSTAGGITPSIVLSRPDNGISNPSMWVAPCAVTFDATGTTKTGEAKPLENLFFSWDYGDGSKANEYWSYGARPGTQSKNRDFGYIGAHVYEVPGTYYVTLTVVDAAGNVNAIRQQIVVTDPDFVFGAANTTYISASGDFADTLAGAAQVTATDITSTLSSFTSGKRILIKGDENYSLASSIAYNFIKDCQIGVYGNGVANIEFTGTGTVGAAILQFTVLNNNNNPSMLDNIQLFKLKITNTSAATSLMGIRMSNFGIVQSPYCDYGHLTVHKCEVYDTITGVYNFEGRGCMLSESVGVLNITSPHGNGGCAVGAGNSNAISLIGNTLDNQNAGEHATRLQGGSAVFVAHNDFRNPAPTKYCFTLRGYAPKTTQAVAWSANATQNIGDYRVMASAPGKVFRAWGVTGTKKTGASEPVDAASANLLDFVIDNEITWRYEFVDTLPYAYTNTHANVFDNYFYAVNVAGDVNTPTQVAPQNNTSHEPREYVLWHANRYSRTAGDATGSLFKLAILADHVTVRNNIVDMSDASTAGSTAFVSVQGNSGSTPPVPACSDVLVENNSIFSTYVGAGSGNKVRVGIVAATATLGIVFRNNVAHTPNNISPQFILDNSGVATSTNNSSDAQMKSSNPFVSANPIAPDDFKLAASSYALAAGVGSDGLFVDYFGTTRSRLVNPDMGAIDATS